MADAIRRFFARDNDVRAQPRHRHPGLAGEGAADRRHPARHRPVPDPGAEPRLSAGLGGGACPLLRPPPPAVRRAAGGDHPRRARPPRDDRASLPAPRRARRLGGAADRRVGLEHGGAGDPDRERPLPRLPADPLRAALGRLRRDARHRPSRHRVALAVLPRHAGRARSRRRSSGCSGTTWSPRSDGDRRARPGCSYGKTTGNLREILHRLPTVDRDREAACQPPVHLESPAFRR